MAAVLRAGDHCYHLSSCIVGDDIRVAASCRDGAVHLLSASDGAHVREAGENVVDNDSEVLRTGWHGPSCLVGASAGGELAILDTRSLPSITVTGGTQCDDQVYGYVTLDENLGPAVGLAPHSALLACGTTIHLLQFGNAMPAFHGASNSENTPQQLDTITMVPLLDLASALPSMEEMQAGCGEGDGDDTGDGDGDGSGDDDGDDSSDGDGDDSGDGGGDGSGEGGTSAPQIDRSVVEGMFVDDWKAGEEEALLSDSVSHMDKGSAAGKAASGAIALDEGQGDEDEEEEEEEELTREVFDLVELPKLPAGDDGAWVADEAAPCCLVAMTLSSGEIAVATVEPSGAERRDGGCSGALLPVKLDVVSYIPAGHAGAAICACALPRIATSSDLHPAEPSRSDDGHSPEQGRAKDGGMDRCFVFATAGLDGYVRLWDLRSPPDRPAAVLSGMCDGAVFALWAPGFEQRVPLAAGLGGDTDWAIMGVGGAVVMAWDARRASSGALSAGSGRECRRAGAVSDFRSFRGGQSSVKAGPVAVLGLPQSKLHALTVCGEEVLVGGEVVLAGDKLCTVASVSLQPLGRQFEAPIEAYHID